jgi:ABC-2 type transport system permease protein
MTRYLRLFGSFVRVSLLTELAFRGNFLIKTFVELLWLSLMVVFYNTLFDKTAFVAGWSKYEYFFFLGCYYVLESLVEAMFLGNFGEFAELIRSGDLDFVLLKPIDEQFIVSTRSFEWSSVPNVLFGVTLMGISLANLGTVPSAARVAGFVIGGACAVAMAYSFLLMLASTSVWLVRNQSLYELWWLFMSLMRYPREIWSVSWANAVGLFFTFVIPVILAINVPASSMVKALQPGLVAYAAAAALVLLVVSRRVFRRALRSYRSASS